MEKESRTSGSAWGAILGIWVAFGLALLALGFQAFGPWGVASPLALAALGVPILLWASRRALIRAEGLPPGDSNRVGKTL